VIYPLVTEPQAISLVGLDVREVHRSEATRCAFLVRRAGGARVECRDDALFIRPEGARGLEV
jgi:hypothetical protein